MRSNVRLVLLVAAALGAAALALPAFAQGAVPEAPRTESFAGAFFMSRRMSPGGGEGGIEVLGSLIIWLLLLLSATSIGLIGAMAMANRRRTIVPADTVAEAKRLVGAGQHQGVLDLAKRDESFFAQVLGAALAESPHGYAAMVRQLEQVSDELATERFRRLEFLNVLGQVSPMIGLFGTVYGMILAFHSIVVAGGNADPVLLAGGIGTALTTTFWGLIVAIPALAGYAVVRNQVDALTAEATIAATEIVGMFRPRGSAK